MDADLSSLEQKLALLIAHAGELRAANEALRRDLAVVQDQNRALSQRMQQATTRLDALLDRLPGELTSWTIAPLQLDVTILGREYRVGCRESERDALLQAVAHLDSRMREIRDAGKVTGVDRIAVMAALNIANDLLRERREPAARRSGPNGRSAGAAIDASDAQRRIREMQAAIDKALARAGQALLQEERTTTNPRSIPAVFENCP